MSCQRQLATAENIPMIDLPSWGLGTLQNGNGRAMWRPSKTGPGAIDWHLSKQGFKMVTAAIVEAMHLPLAQLPK